MNNLNEYMIGCKNIHSNIRYICENDDILEFIGYINNRNILDIYVAMIIYYQANKCFNYLIDIKYNFALNTILTTYIPNNKRLRTNDIENIYTKILKVGGNISKSINIL